MSNARSRMSSSLEVAALRNIVEADLSNPDSLKLAIGGALLEDDPQVALEDLGRAFYGVQGDASGG